MEVTFMEPQEVFYCKEKKEKCNNNKCFGIVTIILLFCESFILFPVLLLVNKFGW